MMCLSRILYASTFSLIFSEGLGEGYDGDIAFASALETFGGGYNDPSFIVLEGMPLSHFFLQFVCCFWNNVLPYGTLTCREGSCR